MATDTYLYPGEPLESDQIRLIRVQPGAWKDPIVCDLYNTRHTNFDDEPIPYFTLSYVWGSHGASREVILSGRPCRVTVNLERALRYYRHHYPYGADLWADALCIDQTNVTERTHQVRLMGQIYSKCKKMVIYLGDRLEYSSGDESDGQQKPRIASRSGHDKKRCSAGLAIRLVRELGSNRHLSHIPSFRNQQDLAHILESLRRLVHAPFTPWWDRVWVVQEAALAPEIDVMQGRHLIPWVEFAEAARNLRVHSTSCCAKCLANLPRDCVKVIEDFTKRVSAVEDSRRGRMTRSLPSLLRTFRNRQASDPRDKVYALLGLTVSNIAPDYSVSEVDAFCVATKECIDSSCDLTILNSDLGRKWREDIPSWVPDWGSPSSPIVEARAAVAAKCYNTSPRFSSALPRMSGRNLIVTGKQVAKVCEVGEMMWGESNAIVKETLAQWWTLFPPSLRSSFWRVICGDVVTSSGFAHITRIDNEHAYRIGDDDDNIVENRVFIWALKSDQSPFPFPGSINYPEDVPSNPRLWRETPMSMSRYQLKNPGAVRQVERWVEFATLSRRLLVFGSSSSDHAQKQMIGLGPSNVQVGDGLFILEGARTPFILRRAHGSESYFTIIGDSYVDGMMDDCTEKYVPTGIWDKIWLV